MGKTSLPATWPQGQQARRNSAQGFAMTSLSHQGLFTPAGSLAAVDTPCLLLDPQKMDANIARLRQSLEATGTGFRPHLKTAKSVDVARRMFAHGHGPATVSTLAEAEAFAQAGFTDLTYAVGITPCKLPRVAALHRQGTTVSVILDSVEQAEAVADFARRHLPIPALVELDCDGHRSGVCPDDHELLLDIASRLAPAPLLGVLTHAGESYHARGKAALAAAAENERACATRAAQILRAAGHACPVVSAGSTPTAFSAQSRHGLTEVRAGVFVFFDLVQAGIGVCSHEDIALSVLATVIGHQSRKGWIIIDAGWTALSADRGTDSQEKNQGLGMVCDLNGVPLPGLTVLDANQEHGIVACRDPAHMPRLPVGARLRILPVHACATVTQHDRYHVLGPDGNEITTTWPRFRGW